MVPVARSRLARFVHGGRKTRCITRGGVKCLWTSKRHDRSIGRSQSVEAGPLHTSRRRCGRGSCSPATIVGSCRGYYVRQRCASCLSPCPPAHWPSSQMLPGFRVPSRPVRHQVGLVVVQSLQIYPWFCVLPSSTGFRVHRRDGRRWAQLAAPHFCRFFRGVRFRMGSLLRCFSCRPRPFLFFPVCFGLGFRRWEGERF